MKARRDTKTKKTKRPGWKQNERVSAFDVSAQAFGMEPWRPAKVREVIFEDGVWWVQVVFEDGGRSSILKPEGVRPGRS
jgi:hypothetical protein